MKYKGLDEWILKRFHKNLSYLIFYMVVTMFLCSNIRLADSFVQAEVGTYSVGKDHG